jgi:hypothetical protein
MRTFERGGGAFFGDDAFDKVFVFFAEDRRLNLLLGMTLYGMLLRLVILDFLEIEVF